MFFKLHLSIGQVKLFPYLDHCIILFNLDYEMQLGLGTDVF